MGSLKEKRIKIDMNDQDTRKYTWKERETQQNHKIVQKNALQQRDKLQSTIYQDTILTFGATEWDTNRKHGYKIPVDTFNQHKLDVKQLEMKASKDNSEDQNKFYWTYQQRAQPAAK